MSNENTKPSGWSQDSVLVKSGVIVVITLILLIPSAWIQGLITDREGYRSQMVSNISARWSDTQLVQGPVLVLPYRKIIGSGAGKDSPAHAEMHNLYVLPQYLAIKARTQTESFKNSIYQTIVYDAKVTVTGVFDKPNFAAAGIDPADVQLDKARLLFGVSDIKGLKNTPVITIDGIQYATEPAPDETALIQALKAAYQPQAGKGFSFSYYLDLKGSNDLNFLPAGKTTDVEVSGDWLHPDFNGRSLPDNRDIKAAGFDAKWHSLYFNRPIPQQWTDQDSVLTSEKVLRDAVFGVKLQLPIDQYRKVLRTAKYAILIIFLTFVSLFLTEMIRKQPIHLFNYALIGLAMVVYYTLLLSFSEHIGFDWAYLLSSVATIGLIGAFTASLLHNKGAAMLFSIILSVFYGFIFIIIQLEDLALLFGSIALFIIVAMLMYFSRKINWDKH
jgi:inner membrane protein